MLLKLAGQDQRDVMGSQITVSGTVVRTDDSGVAVSFGKKYKTVAMRK
jgi:hypothetical protein